MIFPKKATFFFNSSASNFVVVFFFQRRLTIADFSSDGKVPDCRDWFTMAAKVGRETLRFSFTTVDGIGSSSQMVADVLPSILASFCSDVKVNWSSEHSACISGASSKAAAVPVVFLMSTISFIKYSCVCGMVCVWCVVWFMWCVCVVRGVVCVVCVCACA